MSFAQMRLLLTAFLLAAPLPALAQAPDSVPQGGLPPPSLAAGASLQAALAELDRSAGTIVADVGTHPITWGNIADTIRAMPSIVSAVPFSVLYQKTAAQLMQTQALVLRGQSAGLEKDPAVQRRMQLAADQALATEVLRLSLAPNLTDKSLQEVYNALVANRAGPEEVQARLIMVDQYDLAMTLIGQLKEGADFRTLARDYSKDGTAQNGGELGYARLDMLSPDVGSVIFSLAPGQITAYPVKSANSWYIVQVEGRRQPPAPSYQDAKEALEKDMIHAGAPAIMSLALKAAPVKYYGLAGKKADDKKP